MDTLVKTLSDRLDQIARFLLFVSLVAMTLFITLQIIFRVFFTALSWTEELSRYLLVWSSFLGASVAFKKHVHISVSFVVDRLPPLHRKVVQWLSMGLMAIFFLVSIWYGFLLMKLQVFQVSPAMGLKMRYVYTIIPVSFCIMFVHLLHEVLQWWALSGTSSNN
ncbi:C4-dicarboxylate ABC transporter permease [candidate division KSB3 bacterium]|uniref:C4-dicarboxylate ABC transporter permease n=1 Tax=candidate division KSB3 bacterium TaxID=2044937 RepID=A0A2G6KKX5_9BACT|nr:MAG: C4-dicarboxylate ABC transporter permease [candidate division KSB3 bacterium]